MGLKLLVTGDRNWTDVKSIGNRLVVLKEIHPEAIIVHGAAKGADTIVGILAEWLGFEVRPYPADWNQHKKAAGPIRNKQMLNEESPDLVWAFHPNIKESKGTADMIKISEAAGVPVKLFYK